MRFLVVAVPLLIAASVNALAQPATSDGQTVLAPLPAPALTDSDRPSDLLRAARAALDIGRPGEAEEALERAQTRLLDRSVALGQTNTASHNPAVDQISEARRELAAHDRASCVQSIQAAIASIRTQGQ